jgi:hypothetical protein
MYHLLRDYNEWGNVLALIISDKETKDFQKVFDAKRDDIGWNNLEEIIHSIDPDAKVVEVDEEFTIFW